MQNRKHHDTLKSVTMPKKCIRPIRYKGSCAVGALATLQAATRLMGLATTIQNVKTGLNSANNGDNCAVIVECQQTLTICSRCNPADQTKDIWALLTEYSKWIWIFLNKFEGKETKTAVQNLTQSNCCDNFSHLHSMEFYWESKIYHLVWMHWWRKKLKQNSACETNVQPGLD
jgi:hypothetical protein